MNGDQQEPASQHADDETADEPAPQPPAEPDLTAAAFFDIDNTLIHGASMFHWARGLAAHKYLSRSQILDFVWKQTRFVIVGKEDAEDMHDITEEALALVKGRNQDELVELTREIFDEYMVDRFWPGTVALAEGHIDAGQRVWLVSAAPIELAELIAEHLGLSGALGTVSEQVHGVYTGRLSGKPLHGEAKAEAIAELAARENLDLSGLLGFSQRHSDVVHGRHPGGGEPGPRAAAARPAQRMDHPRLPHRPPGGEDHRAGGRDRRAGHGYRRGCGHGAARDPGLIGRGLAIISGPVARLPAQI